MKHKGDQENASRRSRNIGGALLIFIASFCLLSLFSYNASDNCLSVANDEIVKNLGGFYGAVIADALLQSLGLASAVIICIMAICGVKLLTHCPIKLLWTRVPAMLMAATACATVLALFRNYNFAMQMLPGGYIGYFIFESSTKKIHPAIVTIIAAIIFTAFLYLSIALNNDTSEKIGNATGHAFTKVARFMLSGTRAVQKIIMMQYLFDFLRNQQTVRKFFSTILHGSKHKSGASDNANNSYQIQKHGDRLTRIGLNQANTFLRQKIVINYKAPSVELLIKPEIKIGQSTQADGIEQKVTKLLKILDEFGIKGKIIRCHQGPVVTLFELQPQPGTKTSRVVGLASDIARTMEASSARVASIAGRDAIGIELPNDKRTKVVLRDLIESSTYVTTNASIPIILGKNVMNEPIITDLAKMPHLLIAGTTGSGKSVGLNCMILSILYKLPPERCRLIMIDPKMLEFSSYDGIPHLLSPVITDPGKAIMGLKWVVMEMENRYKTMSSLGIRNISNYNEKVSIAKARDGKLIREVDIGYNPETGEIKKEKISIEAKYMPYIVVVIDEMADLMLVAGKEVEMLVQRLAQMARAAGIHLIMATQRPSVDVITGIIKANFPTRVSYNVTSKIDSRTILGEQGAEQLLGQGDMLYMAPGGKIVRIHGPLVTDNEINAVVTYLKSQYRPEYVDITTIHKEYNAEEFSYNDNLSSAPNATGQDSDDLIYQQALRIVLQDKKTSISYVQRKLRIGYNKAANLIEQMEANGILSAPDSMGRRTIVIRDVDTEE